MAAKSTYNQLDLLGGLYERDIREEKFVKLALQEITNLKYVRAQTLCSDIVQKEKDDSVVTVDFVMRELIEICKRLTDGNIKFRLTEWDKYLELPNVNSYETPHRPQIADYFQNSESRLKGYFFAFKDVLTHTRPQVDKIIKYYRYINNLLS